MSNLSSTSILEGAPEGRIIDVNAGTLTFEEFAVTDQRLYC